MDANAENWQLPEFAGGMSTAPPLNKRDQKAAFKRDSQQDVYNKAQPPATKVTSSMMRK